MSATIRESPAAARRHRSRPTPNVSSRFGAIHRRTFAGIGLPDRHPGHYPIEQLLIPIEGTAYYIGATWLKPFATYGAFGITDEALAQSAAQYKALLAE